ncbi:MAG: hypothetical protein D3903_17440, partial [Candidatus Electrothrix sp. GM3_4]|nr:hypothetical protein [Candidatus Electrothrix sp. GM3_4]
MLIYAPTEPQKILQFPLWAAAQKSPLHPPEKLRTLAKNPGNQSAERNQRNRETPHTCLLILLDHYLLVLHTNLFLQLLMKLFAVLIILPQNILHLS